MEVDVATDRIEDPAALVEHLQPILGPVERVEIGELGGGNANDTLSLRWDDAAYVLRIPPESSPAPEILTGLAREAAGLSAVDGTGVFAPTLTYHCGDPSILGAEFLVAERLEGDVLDGEVPDRFDDSASRDRLVDAIVDALAAIHGTDPPAAFTEDPQTAGGYLEAQLDAFRRQLAWAEERTADVRRVESLHALLARLREARPERPTDARLVHGDFKPDNLLVAPGDEAELAGVLDWEMAGRGDPLADLGWLLSFWSDPADPSFLPEDFRERYGDHEQFPVVELYLSAYGAFTGHPDTPDRGAVVDRYEARTGREYRHDRFYRALGAAKLAVICEGFFRSYLEDPGNAKPSYPAMELLPFVLAEQGHRTLDGDVPLRG